MNAERDILWPWEKGNLCFFLFGERAFTTVKNGRKVIYHLEAKHGSANGLTFIMKWGKLGRRLKLGEGRIAHAHLAADDN